MTLSNLNLLNVGRNQLTELPVRQMGQLVALTQLNIQYNNIKKLGPHFAKLKLKSFQWEGNPIKNPREVGRLKKSNRASFN